MKASRELDALVAERVMGWNYLHEMMPCPNPEAERCVRCLSVIWKSDTTVPPCNGFPHYSTDIAAAWLVVEKFSYSDFQIKKDYDFEFWICSIAPPDERFRTSETRAGTAPLAICLAALKALGAV